MSIINPVKLISLILFVFVLSFGQSNILDFFSLTVEVQHLRNSTGVVQFAVYNQNGTIPDETFSKYFVKLTGKIEKSSSVVTFTKLPLGTYAVNILHDENEDEQINKFFILPTEGVGFSNYTSFGPMNRPNFVNASFDLKSDITMNVKVIYL